MGLADTERKLAETRSLLDRGIVPRLEVDALDQQARQQRLDLASAQAELTSTLARGQGENLQIADMELTNATAKHGDLAAARERRTIKALCRRRGERARSRDRRADGAGPGRLRVTPGQPLIGLASVEHLKAIARSTKRTSINCERDCPWKSAAMASRACAAGKHLGSGPAVHHQRHAGRWRLYLVTVSLPS